MFFFIIRVSQILQQRFNMTHAELEQSGILARYANLFSQCNNQWTHNHQPSFSKSNFFSSAPKISKEVNDMIGKIVRQQENSELPEKDTPSLMTVTLYGYQKKGLYWLSEREKKGKNGRGGILADQMGLGKTMFEELINLIIVKCSV